MYHKQLLDDLTAFTQEQAAIVAAWDGKSEEGEEIAGVAADLLELAAPLVIMLQDLNDDKTH